MEIKKVLVASPKYNEPERRTTSEIKLALLGAGFQAYTSRSHDNNQTLNFNELVSLFQKHGLTLGEVDVVVSDLLFHYELFQAQTCDAAVLNLEGRVVDEESLCLATMAYTSGKPLVIYKNDSRSLIQGRDSNVILGMANFEIVKEIPLIPIKLRELEKQDSSPFTQHITDSRRFASDYLERCKTEDKAEAFIKTGLEIFYKKL